MDLIPDMPEERLIKMASALSACFSIENEGADKTGIMRFMHGESCPKYFLSLPKSIGL